MHDGQLVPLIPREQIQATVTRLAQDIARDYQGQTLVLVGALAGAFVFLADLVRALNLPVEIAFVQVASYGNRTVSSGQVEIVQDLRIDLAGRHVMIVEDIVDTGYTAACLCNHLATRQPASLRLCTLLDKPARRRVPVSIDYGGLTIPDVFVIGYGMDWNGHYRGLPDICLWQPAAAAIDHETGADVFPTTPAPLPWHPQ